MTKKDRDLMQSALVCEMFGIINCDVIWEDLATRYDADYLGAEAVKMKRQLKKEFEKRA